MSTPTSPAANGRARKSLEHQLDRFDSILDGLANAPNESVADAVKDAVGQAVREAVQVVVAELVANPQVARALAAAHGLAPPAAPPTPEPVTPPQPKGPGLRERLAARWRRLRAGVAAVKDRGVAAAAGRLSTTRLVLMTAVRLAWSDWRGLTVAAVVGVLVAGGTHLCGPIVSAAVGGVVSGVLTLVGWSLRPLYPVLPLLASARAATGRTAAGEWAAVASARPWRVPFGSPVGAHLTGPNHTPTRHTRPTRQDCRLSS
jgi:hypothetical protein